MKASGIGFKDLPKLADLKPGIKALGFRVLVLARELNDQIEVKMPGGGTKLFAIEKAPGGDLERLDQAGSEGLLVAVGSQAGHERWPIKSDGSPDYKNGHPMVGDVVLFARYSGKHSEFTGEDGRLYRMMNDEDLLGVRDRVEAAKAAEPPQGLGAVVGKVKAPPRAKKPVRAKVDA